LLAQPVAKLSAEELALLRQPVVATSDSNPAGVTASFALPKQGNGPAGPNVETSSKPAVPDELVPLAPPLA
jgi:hypothetical protein